jgi:hypothetical protein
MFFSACFFKTRLHAALKFPIRLSAEAASEKSAKNRFPGLTRAIDRPFAPIEFTDNNAKIYYLPRMVHRAPRR